MERARTWIEGGPKVDTQIGLQKGNKKRWSDGDRTLLKKALEEWWWTTNFGFAEGRYS